MGRGWTAHALGPTATLQAKNAELEGLIHQKVSPGSVEEKQLKDQIKAKACALFDFDALAMRSLGSYWLELSGPQRTEFVNALRELIERRFVRVLYDHLDYQLAYKNEETSPVDPVLGLELASVATVVTVSTNGQRTLADMDFRMQRPALDGAPWLVWGGCHAARAASHRDSRQRLALRARPLARWAAGTDRRETSTRPSAP